MKIYKKIFTSIIIILTNIILHTSIHAQVNKTLDINSILKFSNENYNMGKIQFGQPLEYAVTVENISSDTIIIQNVTVGCGCTTPKFKKGDILIPGSKSNIVLGFNAMSNGYFEKHAFIFFSNGFTKELTFKGETYK